MISKATPMETRGDYKTFTITFLNIFSSFSEMKLQQWKMFATSSTPFGFKGSFELFVATDISKLRGQKNFRLSSEALNALA